MKTGVLLLVFFIIFNTIQSQKMGTMEDTRDGQTYKTVSIKYNGNSHTWFAENLNYKTSDSYLYEKNYGLLYTWEAAKKACPKGWHLPSKEEWNSVLKQFGGETSGGKALKSKQGWKNSGNGSNRSGFNALPAGYRIADGTFGNIGKFAYFWSSSTSEREKRAWLYILFYDTSKVGKIDLFKEVAYSCRCVKD